ncbi:MAG: GtrA family protein [Acidimicrobiales bacterium]
MRELLPRLIRYGAVSVVATLVSLTVLTTLVATGAMPAGWANVVATLVGIVPSFELNRRWVWAASGPPRAAQVVPFVALTLVGLSLSSITVSVTGAWADAAGWAAGTRAAVAAVANVAAFGSLWVAQFVICDRRLFGTRGRRPTLTG